MRTIYITTLLTGVATLIGCGGVNSYPTPGSEDDNSTDRRLLAPIQKYNLITTASSGGNCNDSKGEMIINSNIVSGTIETDWGDILIISGTYNPSSGDIDGGFIKNNNKLAQYTGSIKNNKGSGIWSDSLGCSGTWSGEGYETNYLLPDNNSTSKSINAYDIQGYELYFTYERGTSASINFGCDGTFAIKLSISGVTQTTISGDDITIENHQLQLLSSRTSDKVLISLDDNDNIVEGSSKVRELGSYTINQIKQVSRCNL
jgi:hypothetical protein